MTPVKYAKLHTDVFIPGVGSLKDTLVSGQTHNAKPLTLQADDKFLYLTLGGVYAATVPFQNVRHFIAEPK